MQTEETQMKQAFEEASARTEDQSRENPAQDAQDPLSEELSDAQDIDTEENESQESEFDVKELITENEQLKAQLQQAQEQHKSEVDRLIRAVAETENQKKRIEADIERERKYGNEKLLKALIPVVDSLELALEHTDRDNPVLKPTFEGVENTVTLMLKELKKFGVEAVNPLNQPFDPNLHQAISMAPSAEVEANNVISVMQKGYVLNGRVVRPAMVIVSSGAPKGAAADDEPKHSINIEA